MRIERVEVAGFGCLVDREFEFAPGLNVICGPNEAGKSTLLQAILALLYGFPGGRGHLAGLSPRDLCLPWQGDRFSGNLVASLDDGQRFRLERDFKQERTKVYRQPGAEDVTNQFNPGRRGLVDFADQYLGLSTLVFQASALIRQEGLELEKGDVDALHSKLETLADSGGVEQSAQKALEKLEEWRKNLVNPRAHIVKNSPLQIAQEEVQRLAGELAASRAALENLASIVADLHDQGRALDEVQREITRVDGAIAWREREELKGKLDQLRMFDGETDNLGVAYRERERELREPMAEHLALAARLAALTVERLDQLRRDEAQVNVETARLRAIAIPPSLIAAIFGVVGLLLGLLTLGRIGALVGAAAFASVAFVWSWARKRRRDQDLALLQKRQKLLATALAEFGATSADNLQTAWNYKNKLADQVSDLAGHRATLDARQDVRRALLGGDTPEDWQSRYAELARRAVDPGPEDRRTRGELQKRQDQVQDIWQKVTNQLTTLRTQYKERLKGIVDPVEIEELLAVASEKLARVKRLQQALVDATTLIKRAAEDYRRDFAPRLSQSLGPRLSRATRGRYTVVEVSQDLKIHVYSAERGGLVTLDQLSRGTRDAVALLLRASVVDLLSTSTESVPLFLDDPLVHVDPERCQATLAVLGELATVRQIFYFTQDPRVVEWVGGGAMVHELAGR